MSTLCRSLLEKRICRCGCGLPFWVSPANQVNFFFGKTHEEGFAAPMGSQIASGVGTARSRKGCVRKPATELRRLVAETLDLPAEEVIERVRALGIKKSDGGEYLPHSIHQMRTDLRKLARATPP